MSSQSRSGPSNNKVIRSMPGNAPNGTSVVFAKSESGYEERYRIQVSQRKMAFTRSVIQAQVKQMLTSDGAFSTEKDPKLFSQYHIDKNAPVYQDSGLKMYRARYSKLPDYPTMVRIHALSEVPPNCLYLKILRHLGRKHPKLVLTLDIFADASNVYIFQEYVSSGNMVEFLEKSPIVPEAQAQVWAKQLAAALDFLTDQGIVHRSITPNHLLVQRIGHENCLKLTGMKVAAIYLDLEKTSPSHDNIAYLPCWPASRQKADGPNFQAPEVYGHGPSELFNPLLADLWSFGANVYFFLAKQYPYNIGGGMADLDAEILANIHHQLSTLSADGHNFLYSTMRVNANNRMPFHFIEQHPWMHSVRSHLTSTNTVMQTPFKKMEKIKVRKSAGKGSEGDPKSSIGKHSSSPASTAAPSSGSPKSPIKSGPGSSGSTKVKTKVKVKVKAVSKTVTTSSSKF